MYVLQFVMTPGGLFALLTKSHVCVRLHVQRRLCTSICAVGLMIRYLWSAEVKPVVFTNQSARLTALCSICPTLLGS